MTAEPVYPEDQPGRDPQRLGELLPDVLDVMAEVWATRRTRERRKEGTIMSQPEIGDDDFDTGCTDGCPEECMADHQGEQ